MDLITNGKLWFNDGEANFQTQQRIVGSPRSVAFADIDGDGDLDVLSGDYPSNSIWLNNGQGQFTKGDNFVGGSASRIRAGDLDGDGDLDAVVADGFGGNPMELIINANGQAEIRVRQNNFQQLAEPGQRVTYEIVVSNSGEGDAPSVTVVDEFPDEITEIVWSCAASAGSQCTPNGSGDIRDNARLLSGGSLVYTVTGLLAAELPAEIRNVASISLPEGQEDIQPANNTSVDIDVVAPISLTLHPNSHQLRQFELVQAQYRETPNIQSLSDDSLVVRSIANSGSQTTDHELSFNGNALSRWVGPLRPGELIELTLTGDVAGDNDQASLPSYVWRQRARVGPDVANRRGTGIFENSDQNLGDSVSETVAMGDFDGDGDLDIFVDNFFGEDQHGRIWLNDGNGTFMKSPQTLGFGISADAEVGDLDADGDLDIFVTNVAFEESIVWLNDGAGVFQDSGQEIRQRGNTSGVALGDVDGDGDLDALLTVGRDFSAHAPAEIWLNDGSGTFHDSGHRLSASVDASLGDLDNDGDLDAFLVGRGGNTVWTNDGNGHFRDTGQQLGLAPSHRVELGDIDADGDLDAVVANQGPNSVWVNDGTGIFESTRFFGNSFSQAISLGDVDGDGDLDAAIGNLDHSNRIFLNDGMGHFRSSRSTLGNLETNAIALADLDDDGDLDAVLISQGQNQVWLNQNRQLVLGDVNHDGIFDSSDLVIVFSHGEYDDNISKNSSFDEGDWNGDGEFDSADLVVAFQAGQYVNGSKKTLIAATVDSIFTSRFEALFDPATESHKSTEIP